jgi:hypothetical protein
LTKVEEVARAIAGAADLHHPDYDAMARAAIKAMREPTQEMAGAPDDIFLVEARDIWRAMIDAALSEGEG